MSFALIFSRRTFLIFQAKKIVTISCFYFDKSIELKERCKDEDEKDDRDRRLFMRLFILFMLFIILCFISYFMFFSIIFFNCCMTLLISMISILSSLRLCCCIDFLDNELIDS